MTEEWGGILVVDDDAEMRELVHDVLKDGGHQVTMASIETTLEKIHELTDLYRQSSATDRKSFHIHRFVG